MTRLHCWMICIHILKIWFPYTSSSSYVLQLSFQFQACWGQDVTANRTAYIDLFPEPFAGDREMPQTKRLYYHSTDYLYLCLWTSECKVYPMCKSGWVYIEQWAIAWCKIDVGFFLNPLLKFQVVRRPNLNFHCCTSSMVDLWSRL